MFQTSSVTRCREFGAHNGALSFGLDEPGSDRKQIVIHQSAPNPWSIFSGAKDFCINRSCWFQRQCSDELRDSQSFII